MQKLLLLFPLLLAACGSTVPISQGATRIQVLKQNSTLVSSCSRVGPITTTVDRAWPAQSVYDAAVWEARNQAAAMGADSLVIIDSTQRADGFVNIITVQAAALRCY